MILKVRSYLSSTKGLVATIGGLASVAVALVSVQLQVADNAQQARIDRSFTLYDHFISSESVAYLMTVSGFIELEVSRAVTESASPETAKRLSAEISARKTGPDFYNHMTQLLRQGSAIARCAGFGEEVSDGWTGDETMCDRETISTLFGESIVDLFFTLRPVLYCSSFVRSFRNHIEPIEAVVAAQLREQGYAAYKTREEIPATMRDAEPFVLRFGPEGHCAPFKDEPQTAALAKAAKAG